MDKTEAYQTLLNTPGVPELIGTSLIVGLLLGILAGIILAWLAITISLGRVRRRVNATWKAVERIGRCMQIPEHSKE